MVRDPGEAMVEEEVAAAVVVVVEEEEKDQVQGVATVQDMGPVVVTGLEEETVVVGVEEVAEVVAVEEVTEVQDTGQVMEAVLDMGVVVVEAEEVAVEEEEEAVVVVVAVEMDQAMEADTVKDMGADTAEVIITGTRPKRILIET